MLINCFHRRCRPVVHTGVTFVRYNGRKRETVRLCTMLHPAHQLCRAGACSRRFVQFSPIKRKGDRTANRDCMPAPPLVRGLLPSPGAPMLVPGAQRLHACAALRLRPPSVSRRTYAGTQRTGIAQLRHRSCAASFRQPGHQCCIRRTGIACLRRSSFAASLRQPLLRRRLTPPSRRQCCQLKDLT